VGGGGGGGFFFFFFGEDAEVKFCGGLHAKHIYEYTRIYAVRASQRTYYVIP